MRSTRHGRAVGLALVVTVVGLGAPSAHAAAGCAAPAAPGGEWRSYGHDYSNSRNQDAEKTISPANASLLSPAWAFSTTRAGGSGDVTGTPIVADGCVYTATTRGWVFALNADTGELVWKAKVPYGGYVTSSPGVAQRTCGTRTVRVRTTKYVRVRTRKHRRSRRHSTKATRHHRKRSRRRVAWTVKRIPVRCGAVYVDVSRTKKVPGCPPGDPCVGPYVAAFDQRTGQLAFGTRSLDTQPGSDTFTSPVIFDGVLMVGISGGSAEVGDEADRYAFQGSMMFLDSSTGQTLRKTWTIHPPDQPKDDYAGGGIWSTPAVDTQRKLAYAGAGNPFRPQVEHEHTNAVLKYDLDRRSPRFGQIVGSYKGVVDEYFPGASKDPCYDIPGNPPPYYPQGVGSCGDLDLDFGAAPNLFRGPDGRLLVGAGQKSGVYHVFDADTMKREWTQLVGPPTEVGGIVGSTAYDGSAVYGPITVPGYLWSVSAGAGGYRWAAPTADGAHYGEPVAVANGVVYTVDLGGFLDVFDAKTGAQLAKRPLGLGGSSAVSPSWGGVSIARNTVYAAVGMLALEQGWVVAFRPGGVDRAAGDIQRTLAELAHAPAGGSETPAGVPIVAVPGSTYSSYATPTMITHPGGAVTFVNVDVQQHDVVSDDKNPDGTPLFSSPLTGTGEYEIVDGTEHMQAGHSYGFHCSIHPGMHGTLVVR